jgi:hypothetical protein
MWLRPTKHSDPSRTVLAVAAEILDRLRRQRVESFVELRRRLSQQGAGVASLFIPAISLLYALGLVEYRRKTDSFEYTGP